MAGTENRKPLPRVREGKPRVDEGKTYYEGHPDLVTPEQRSFDVVVEQVIGSVEVGNGFGTTPTVAAFTLVAEYVEEQPRGTGEDVNLTFRFMAAGGMHSITVHVV